MRDDLYVLLEGGDLDGFMAGYGSVGEALAHEHEGFNVVNALMVANVPTERKLKLYRQLLPLLEPKVFQRKLDSKVLFQAGPLDRGTYTHVVELLARFNEGGDIVAMLALLAEAGYRFSADVKFVVREILRHNPHVSVEEGKRIAALMSS